jgi:hypothetical protein
MSYFITTTAVENTRSLAQSALPDAPVVPDPPARPATVRARLSEALRTAARHELRLADRIDPRCEPQLS